MVTTTSKQASAPPRPAASATRNVVLPADARRDGNAVGTRVGGYGRVWATARAHGLGGAWAGFMNAYSKVRRGAHRALNGTLQRSQGVPGEYPVSTM
jgi:hypothetical protein